MSLLIAPLLPVGAVALLALLLLRTQRASSADQRRVTAIGAVLICLCFCAAPLVGSRWPVTVPTVTTSTTQIHPLSASSQPENPSEGSTPNHTTAPATGSRTAASRIAFDKAASSLYLRALPAVGACCIGAWFVAALVWGERLRASGTRASERVQQECAYDVRIVPGLTIPACLGGVHPVVLLPDGADDWSRETLIAVLRHEEAHIRHRDHLWNGVAFLLCALQWFNPLAWLLLSRLRLESERVADDAVLAQGLAPHTYSKALLQFQPSSSSPHNRRLPIVAQPLIRKSGMAIRLEAILTQNRRSTMTRKQFALTMLSACVFGASASGAALSQTGVRRMIAVSPAVPPITPPADVAPDLMTAVRPPIHPRKMELVQVGVKDGNHPAIVWDAKGNLVPPSQVLVRRWRPNDVEPGGYIARYRHIVFRVQAEPGDMAPLSGIGSPSGGISDHMPPFTIFGYASSDYLMTKNGWHYFVAHLSVEPAPDSQIKPPVKDLGIYHLPYTNIGVSVTCGAWEDRGLINKYPAESKYHAERVASAAQLPKGIGKRPPTLSKVQFRIPVVPNEGFDKYVVTLHSGKRLPGNPENLMAGSFGGGYSDDRKSMNLTYYIEAAPDDIAEVRRFTRTGLDMNLTNVPLSPRVSH